MNKKDDDDDGDDDDNTNHSLSDHHKWMVLNQAWSEQYQRSISLVFEKEAPPPISQTEIVQSRGGGDTIVRTILQALFQRSSGNLDWKYGSNLLSPNGIVSIPTSSVDDPHL